MSDEIEIRNPFLPSYIYQDDRVLLNELNDRKITFSSIVDTCETPTLIGKAVVGVIGLAGAGNGRCLLSDTLPRMNTVVEEDYRLVGYCLSLMFNELTVGAMIRRVDADPVGMNVGQALLVGPQMHLSAHSRDYVRATKPIFKSNPVPSLLKLYKMLGIDYSKREEGLTRRIEHFADNGRYLVFTPAGIGFWLNAKPEVVTDDDVATV